MASGSEAVLDAKRIDVPDDPFGDGYDDRRLWIGNLDLRMTEYAVLKMVQKFGAIRKMDFIYHKGGPDKGKSKGYCFISFHSWEVAEEARKGLDGRWCMGRPLYVKWAHGSKYDDAMASRAADAKKLKSAAPLSSQASLSSSSTSSSMSSSTSLSSSDPNPQSKIMAIEAKLKMMEDSQNDCGLHDIIRPPPGGVPPVNLYQRNEGSRSHNRSHPYRRGQASRHRQHR